MAAVQTVWQAGDASLPEAWPDATKTMTLLVRVKNLRAVGDLAVWHDAEGKPVARLFVVEDAGKHPALLCFELAFAFNPVPLRLSAPTARLGAGQAHRIVVRHLGYRLELFIDGVLVDEDWPVGLMRPARGVASIASGVVEHLSWWSRALDDDEVQVASGGREGLAAREDRYLGAMTPLGQYWRPRGFDVNVGDCMPFFDESSGQFHLFYLFDRRHGASMWGCGAHQWAHATTTDLVHWEHHPLALAIDGDLTGSICTGSVFSHAGIFYAFYAVRMADRTPAPLCVATSRDGVHFVKAPPLMRLAAPYDSQASRDPVVFRDAATGLFHMLATTALADPAQPGAWTGCLAWFVSRDLEHWEQREPFYVPGGADHPECPDYFEWNGWYYLLFSLQGIARYRMSRQPFGPWQQPPVDTLDGPKMRVMKTAAFHGNRRIGAVFVADTADGYAGAVVFRELVQHPDGTLTTQWPVEMAPRK